MTFPKWRVNGNEHLVKRCHQFAGQPEAIDLLTQMMQLEPSKRITVKGALQHPFFRDYNQITVSATLPSISPTKHRYKVMKSSPRRKANHPKTQLLCQQNPPRLTNDSLERAGSNQMKSLDLLQRRGTRVIAEEEQSPQADKDNDNYSRALRENDINL